MPLTQLLLRIDLDAKRPWTHAFENSRCEGAPTSAHMQEFPRRLSWANGFQGRRAEAPSTDPPAAVATLWFAW